MLSEDFVYRPTNREAAREPRGRHFWCSSCDHDLVQAGSRCSYCGHPAGKQRAKKPTPLMA